MIYAEKVEALEREWIKIEFTYHPAYVEAIKRVPGARYNPKSKFWSVPYGNRKEFTEIMGDFLVLWRGEKQEAGGIDENTIPIQPLANGYSVSYDSKMRVTESTGFKSKPLAEYQVRGFNSIYNRSFLLLCDDCGTGKTFQTVAALAAKKEAGMLERGIILCKASLLYNWQAEIERFSNCSSKIFAGSPAKRLKILKELINDASWTFLICSYETFRVSLAEMKKLHKAVVLDFLVCDEAQVIKNPTSAIGKAVHKLKIKNVYLLTATPLPNTPLEAFNYLKLGGLASNWWAFRKRHGLFGGFEDKEIIGFQHVQELLEYFKKHMLRRLKEDKLAELPDILFRTVPLAMTGEQKRIYKNLEKEVELTLINKDLKENMAVLERLLRLQQMADTPLLLSPDSDFVGAKILALDDLLATITESGAKAIVFSRFRSMINILLERYANYQPAVIHGEISSNAPEGEVSRRQKMIERFQTDEQCKVFFGTLGACREGINLTASSHVIFLDCEWSPAYTEQAYSRAYRIGQKNAVTVHFLVCINTIDQIVQRVLEEKRLMTSHLLDRSPIEEALFKLSN